MMQYVVSTLIYPFYKARQEKWINQARIITYHNVSEFPSERQIPYDNVSPSLFERHMSILSEEGYNVVHMGKMIKLLNSGNIPPKTIAITFDDGFKNNYLNAVPILLDKGFKATFFIIAGSIGDKVPFRHLLWDDRAKSYVSEHPESRLPMNAKELVELRTLGMEIGAHGLSHRSIGNLDSQSAWEEITNSKMVLEEHLKTPIHLFAYPFGARAYNDFNRATADMLKQAGFSGVCVSDIGSVGIDTDPYELPRIPIREKDNERLFRQKIAGAYDWVNFFKDAFQRKAARIENVN